MGPILDSHVHFWDPRRLAMPWLSMIPALDRPLGPAEYRSATAAPVTAVVLVEAGGAAPELELEHALELAATDPLVAAVVAYAPLDDGDEALPYLEMLAGSTAVRAVRRNLAFEPDARVCVEQPFVHATRALARWDLACELCVTGEQLEVAATLVRRCPDVRFVLDHAGNPDIRGRRIDPWRADIDRLAALPNVWCKLSGLPTQADRAAWLTADLAPFVGHVVERFGWGRLLFGSDWPIVTQAAPLDRWLEAMIIALGHPGERELDQVLRLTGCGVYRIDPSILLDCSTT